MTDVDVVVTPQELTAALRALLERKHLSQGQVIRNIDNAGGKVSASTLSTILSGKTGLPRWRTLEQILQGCGVSSRGMQAWEAAYRRAGQEAAGDPLTDDMDAFAFGVHRTITSDLPGEYTDLTPYVPRPHDTGLAEIAAAAAGGRSRFVVLVGGSSTGKTRALWEALAPLRKEGGWRLWHPTTPNRRIALIEGIARVRPRTVVWLNESQEYLGGDSRRGDEQPAITLRDLLNDPGRGPVLVVGTLWREYYTELMRPHASMVRELLDNTNLTTVLDVPDSFTDADPDDLSAAASDPRFAYARDRAEYARITQYLAGGQELLRRYRFALSTAAKAIVHVAMDARRMGHRNAIPHALLAEAAHAYMTPQEWNRVAANSDWIDQALDEARQLCKGADGPLTSMVAPPRSPRSRAHTEPKKQAGAADQGPVYALADFLDQYARTVRANLIPPSLFWEAVADYACVGDYAELGRAAYSRGLYRSAAQLWRQAVRSGDADAVGWMTFLLHEVHPADDRPAMWAVDQKIPGTADAAATLLERWQIATWAAPAQILAERAVSTVAVNNPRSVTDLLEVLQEGGWSDLARILAERAAPAVDVDDSHSATYLLELLQEGGWSDLARILAERVASTVYIDGPRDTRRPPALYEIAAHGPRSAARLLQTLQGGGWPDLARIVAERAVSTVDARTISEVHYLWKELRNGQWLDLAQLLMDHVAARLAQIALLDFDSPANLESVAHELWELHRTWGPDMVRPLAERAASTTATNPRGLAPLVTYLRLDGRCELARALAERATPACAVDDGGGVALLLRELRQAGWLDLAQPLAERVATQATLDDVFDRMSLFEELRLGGWSDSARALYERAAVDGLDRADDVTHALAQSLTDGCLDLARLLAERAVSTVAVERLVGIASLLMSIRVVGWPDLARVLAERAAVAELGTANTVAKVLAELQQAGWHDLAQLLAERAAAAIDPKSSGVAELLKKLREDGWHDLAQLLAERAAAAFDPISNSTSGLIKELRSEKGAEVTKLVTQLTANGHFFLFLDSVVNPHDYRFGREPDGQRAPSWDWDDLL